MAADGETITYGELEARANRGARTLRALGLQNGEAVAIACDNRTEFFDIYWAAQRSGLILVLLSARLKTDEIAYIVGDSSAKVVLISDKMASTARDCVANKAAMPFLDPAVANDPAIYPDAETLSRMYTPKPQSEEQEREMTRAWSEIKAG